MDYKKLRTAMGPFHKLMEFVKYEEKLVGREGKGIYAYFALNGERIEYILTQGNENNPQAINVNISLIKENKRTPLLAKSYNYLNQAIVRNSINCPLRTSLINKVFPAPNFRSKSLRN